MASSKGIIADQVLYRLAGGYPDAAFPIKKYDVFKAIEQKVNEKFKVSHFQAQLPSGETIPDGLSYATYEGITVETYGCRSRAILPVMPISLPRNLGVYQIWDDAGNVYIPMQLGQFEMLQSQPLISDLLGQTGFWPVGKSVVFTKDITLYDVTSVNMHLIVLDTSQYGEYDILPMPADYESAIVDELVKAFAPSIVPGNKIIDNVTSQPDSK
jgi:hypothetical protein